MKALKMILSVFFFLTMATFSNAQPADQPTSQDISTTTKPISQDVTISTHPNNDMTTTSTISSPSAQVELRMAMRRLWEDHIVFTRNYIISELANLQDVEAVSKRLLQNQDDIGNAIKPYYGDEAGNKLTKLLREHILIATKVVKAAKANDEKALHESQQKWRDNADEIATFLSSANPNWSKDDLQVALRKHLELTTGEVTSRLKKDWVADIDFYDRGEDHMLHFSDTLTDGIVKQFPQKFNL